MHLRLRYTTADGLSPSLGHFLTAVGSEEASARTVNVRNRDDIGTKARGVSLPLTEVVEKMVALKAERRLENRL